MVDLPGMPGFLDFQAQGARPRFTASVWNTHVMIPTVYEHP